MLFLFD